MTERILTGWTFTRILYLAVGGFIIVHSIMDQQWFSAAIGGYFAAMGIFSFGCAAGNCVGGNCSTETQEASDKNIEDVEFEEVRKS